MCTYTCVCVYIYIYIYIHTYVYYFLSQTPGYGMTRFHIRCGMAMRNAFVLVGSPQNMFFVQHSNHYASLLQQMRAAGGVWVHVSS